MATLSSKVALITGSAQGIGLTFSRLLLQRGAKVSMVDVSETVGRDVCGRLQTEFSPNNVMFTPADVTNYKQLRCAFESTMELFGHIDVVCNNAGIGTHDEDKWRKMIDINLTAVVDGTFLGIEFLSRQKGGRGGVVINMASMGGIYPMPYAPVYAASKCGVVGFSRSMTNYLKTDGVRVNCICPAFTDTQMVHAQLLGSSEAAVATHTEQGSSAIASYGGLLSPEAVAEAMVQLVIDESQNGVTMSVTLQRGVTFFSLPGDGKKISPKL